MKSLKKALAVLLSVLMVAFSFPLTSFALPNKDNADGKYSYDEDVVLHTYVVDYDNTDSWGYLSDYYLTDLDGKGTVPTYDLKNLKKSDLKSQDGTFALVVTVENVDQADCLSIIWAYAKGLADNDVIPASYQTVKKKTVLTTGEAAGNSCVLGTWGDLNTAIDASDVSGINIRNSVQTLAVILGNTPNSTAWDNSYVQDDENEDAVFKGQFLAAFGLQMTTDEVDLTEALPLYQNSGDTFINTMKGYDDKDLVVYNSLDDNMKNPSPRTQFIMPEWGLQPASEDVTYTYIYNDKTSTTVTAAAGETPTAPKNTATVGPTSDGKGNHVTKSYSWPEFVEGTTTYTEEETVNTVSCAKTLEKKEDAVAPTHTKAGKTAKYKCSVCGYTTGGTSVDPTSEHSWEKTGETPSTCKTQGTISYKCECGETKTEYKVVDPTNHENVVTDAAVPATCVDTGLTAGSHCAACDTVIVAQQQTSVDKTNHVGDIKTGVNAKEATRGEDGYTGDSVCSACGVVVVKGQAIPATGVMITVNASDKGATTLNGAATTGAAQKVAYEKEYTLTATPAANAKFVGWQVNGKLVSTDSTYTTAAYADLTYTPVFAADEAKAFNVTFVDQFNNVIAELSNEDVAALNAMPTPYEYKGFTFKGWSMDLDAVKALTGAATVVASYEKDAAVTYTVTAPTGCTITVDGKDMGTVATVSHDAKVTVSAANEGTWKINGNDAAFGSEYTFFVTANVNVEFAEGAVTAQPVVTAVATDKLASNKVRFLATRSVPEDYNLLESGFVFGKDVADTSTLVLENVGNGAYCYKNSNTAADGQFALTLKTTASSVSARAYIIVEKDGVSQVIYAEPQTATLA